MKVTIPQLAGELQQYDFPAVAWCAIIGNAMAESGLETETGPVDHGSDGLFQWRGARLERLKKRPDWKTPSAQVAFLVSELRAAPGSPDFDVDYSGLYAELMRADRPLETLTLNFCDRYERPSVAGRRADARIGFARDAARTLGVTLTPDPTLPPREAPRPPILTTSSGRAIDLSGIVAVFQALAPIGLAVARVLTRANPTAGLVLDVVTSGLGIEKDGAPEPAPAARSVTGAAFAALTAEDKAAVLAAGYRIE